MTGIYVDPRESEMSLQETIFVTAIEEPFEDDGAHCDDDEDE